MWKLRAVNISAAETLPPCAAGVIYTKPWMVELILDLAGYLPERPLFKLVALEPSAGDGAFLQGMVRRLVESCRCHGVALTQAAGAIGAFEIDRDVAERGIDLVESTLIELGISPPTASDLARRWIKVDDFLEASLAFPVADFVIGNPPYIRLEEIPANKAAFYRSGFSAMRGRADIYVAFYQAALLQLKPGGVCAFICADRWMLNDYGSALREFKDRRWPNIVRLVFGKQIAVDAWLKELARADGGLKSLTTLYLWERQVTDAGGAELQKARPGLKIIRW